MGVKISISYIKCIFTEDNPCIAVMGRGCTGHGPRIKRYLFSFAAVKSKSVWELCVGGPSVRGETSQKKPTVSVSDEVF